MIVVKTEFFVDNYIFNILVDNPEQTHFFNVVFYMTSMFFFIYDFDVVCIYDFNVVLIYDFDVVFIYDFNVVFIYDFNVVFYI